MKGGEEVSDETYFTGRISGPSTTVCQADTPMLEDVVNQRRGPVFRGLPHCWP